MTLGEAFRKNAEEFCKEGVRSLKNAFRSTSAITGAGAGFALGMITTRFIFGISNPGLPSVAFWNVCAIGGGFGGRQALRILKPLLHQPR